jgi:hypothetical protein
MPSTGGNRSKTSLGWTAKQITFVDRTCGMVHIKSLGFEENLDELQILKSIWKENLVRRFSVVEEQDTGFRLRVTMPQREAIAEEE